MKKFALIVAGGSGTRMGGAIPKQFLLLRNKPVLLHTLERFYAFDVSIELLVVLPEAEIPRWKELCTQFKCSIPHRVVSGGRTRFHSVKNGLNSIVEEGIIGIHDGVRPLVSIETLERTFRTAAEKGNAIPVIFPSESVRYCGDAVSRSVPREQYCLVQTPQCFQSGPIKKAFEQEYNNQFTDDASVLEADGKTIHLVAGNPENIKLTTPSDLLIASALMDQ